MTTSTTPYTRYLQGPLDAMAMESLRPELDLMVSCHRDDILLDLSAVDFIDSSGIGALVFLYKRLRAQHRNLQLCGLNGQPLQLIQYLRIDQTIAIVDTPAGTPAATGEQLA